MTDDVLFKKMRLQPGQRLLLINADTAWEKTFSKSLQVATTPDGFYDHVLLFAPDKAALAEFAEIARRVVSAEGVIWAAFPKGSSGMQTDLTRDKGWESISPTDWQFLKLISLDDKWSAFSYRRASEQPTRMRRALRENATENAPKTANPYIDTENRLILLPEDLGQALAENKNALVFFETLSFTNRKEYVNWVLSAKREETRQKRVLETVAKLEQKLKNPMDKGERQS